MTPITRDTPGAVQLPGPAFVSREDLYQAVWSRPVAHVAKEIGLSDRGLAKRCKSLDIPVPPRGYWERLKAGQEVHRPPLPYRRALTPLEQWEANSERWTRAGETAKRNNRIRGAWFAFESDHDAWHTRIPYARQGLVRAFDEVIDAIGQFLQEMADGAKILPCRLVRDAVQGFAFALAGFLDAIKAKWRMTSVVYTSINRALDHVLNEVCDEHAERYRKPQGPSRTPPRSRGSLGRRQRS